MAFVGVAGCAVGLALVACYYAIEASGRRVECLYTRLPKDGVWSTNHGETGYLKGDA